MLGQAFDLDAAKGLVVGDATTIQADGTLTLSGGTLTTGSFDNSAGGTFNFQDGTLTVTGGTFAPNTGGLTDRYIIDGLSEYDLPHLVLSAGSSTTIGGDLTVGDWFRGELTITDGGVISSRTCCLGSLRDYGYYESSGMVTIDGLGSTLTVSRELHVGVMGHGTMDVLNGGAISSAGGTIYGDSYNIFSAQ